MSLHSARTRTTRRLAAVAGTAVVLVAGTALPAIAHVRVSSPDAAPGGFGKLVFKVPTESDTASTTALTVRLPKDTPFAFVSSKPVPGWTVASQERKLARPLEVEGFRVSKVVSTVTWTAGKGQGIKPGQFDEFELSVGPFPKSAGPIAMPAVQRYSDGTVVRWNEPTEAGQDEPEHPSPVLDLAASADPTQEGVTAGTQDASLVASSTDAAASAAAGSDDTARWLGGAGLVLGAAALAVALVGRRRRA